MEEIRKDEIKEKLKKIVQAQLGVKEDEISSEAKFKENLGADSLDIVEIVMKIEDEFKLEIPDDDLNKDEDITFGQLVDYVFGRLN